MPSFRSLCLAACATLLAGSVLVQPAAAEAKVSFADRVCNVRDYGADGGRLMPETAAFQKAIDDCAAKGGGTVEIPRGWWYVGPLFLKSNINLHVAKYAVVQFATIAELYGTTEHPLSAEGKSADFALINITNASNVAITGEGVLDGQGYVWWEWMRAYWRQSAAAKDGVANQRQKVTRPKMLIANNVQNLLLEGVTFTNSPSFHVVVNHSDDVTIRNTSILAPASSPNTDGIDPGNSRNVLIEGNTISCGDDIVAIKGSGPEPGHPAAAVSNIVIRNNRIFAGHGISIGSGTSGGVKHVLIENNSFEGSFHGFRIKTRRGYGGEVSDIVFRNNTMKDVQNVLTIADYFQYAPLDLAIARTQVAKGGMIIVDLMYPPDDDPAQPFVENQTPDIHDVVIDGLVATGSENAGIVLGIPEKEIANITMKNVRIEAQTGLIVRNAAIAVEATAITAEKGKSVVLQRHGRYKVAK
jgi:polygalacturonase